MRELADFFGRWQSVFQWIAICFLALYTAVHLAVAKNQADTAIHIVKIHSGIIDDTHRLQFNLAAKVAEREMSPVRTRGRIQRRIR